MTPVDFDEFRNAMRGAWLSVTNGKEEPSGPLLDVFWKLFRDTSIQDFKAAVIAHLRDPKRGMFTPKPADIMAQLQAHDGRPSADEAWGIALQALSEEATIVWTPEIRAAWRAAETIAVEGRDKIGARKAFMDAYGRLVEASRGRSEPVSWEVSLGFNQDEREQAIQQASMLNRIGNSQAAALIEMVKPLALPAPEDDGVNVLNRIAECRSRMAMDRAARQADEDKIAEQRREASKKAVAGLMEANRIMAEQGK
jgi:hypothetical protein